MRYQQKFKVERLASGSVTLVPQSGEHVTSVVVGRSVTPERDRGLDAASSALDSVLGDVGSEVTLTFESKEEAQ